MQYHRAGDFADRIEQCKSLTGLRSLLREIIEAGLTEPEFRDLYAQLVARRLVLLEAACRPDDPQGGMSQSDWYRKLD